ncbi:MAG: hypothetical protein IIX02_05465 [Clostridia bacterium]|nr:hypothetical protein [Clostridia bacterium]
MWLIIIQYFFMLIVVFNVSTYPLVGVVDKLNSKVKKDCIYVIGAVVMTVLILCGILSIIFLDKEDVILWYCLTLFTVIISNIVLLNTDINCKRVESPKTFKDYVHNAKCDYFESGFGRFLLKSRFLIYLWYILVAIFNQVGELSVNIFSDSLYLRVNEYSLIVLFAIDEMIKLYRKRKQV